MVSAVSNQAATLNPLAYAAQTGDDTTQQTAPDATTNDSDRGPATQVSLSQEAVDSLRDSLTQGPDALRQALDAFSQKSDDWQVGAARNFDDMRNLAEMRVQLHEMNRNLDAHNHARENLADTQAEYDRLLNTKPVPQQELTGKAKEAALELLSSRGHAPPAPGHSIGFPVGNLYYHFYGDDGSVLINDINVPISEDVKQSGLSRLRESISMGQEDTSAVVAQRDALQAQYDALYAKLNPQSSN